MVQTYSSSLLSTRECHELSRIMKVAGEARNGITGIYDVAIGLRKGQGATRDANETWQCNYRNCPPMAFKAISPTDSITAQLYAKFGCYRYHFRIHWPSRGIDGRRTANACARNSCGICHGNDLASCPITSELRRMILQGLMSPDRDKTTDMHFSPAMTKKHVGSGTYCIWSKSRGHCNQSLIRRSRGTLEGAPSLAFPALV